MRNDGGAAADSSRPRREDISSATADDGTTSRRVSGKKCGKRRDGEQADAGM